MSEIPGGQPPVNPKAAAKAAKAYAKAERPWFKKKRFMIPIAVVAIAAIASAGSGGGGGSKDDNDTDPPTSASQSESPATNDEKPAAKADNSSKGKGPIAWGNWEVVGKLQVSKNAANMYDVVARVKNTGDAVDQGLFTITILKGDQILGTADCHTSDVNPGATATAQCFSTNDFVPGWTEVTIENMM